MSGIITTLTDLGKSMKILRISMELEDVSDKTSFGFSIKNALRENKLREVVEMIKDQASDNRTLVTAIIGEELMKDIDDIIVLKTF